MRQPGPRRRRYADLGMRAARPRLQCRAERQDGHQRDGGVVHRHAALAERLQVAARKSRCGSTRRWLPAWCPYHHIIGGENGMGEDRRWLEPAHKYFDWMAKHDVHFINKRSIANLGVVMGQRTHLFYQAAARRADARVHGRHVLRAARRPLPLRFRA